MAREGARRRRATITWVAVSVAVVVLIPLVGLAALLVVEKVFYGGCGSPAWQTAVEAEARAALPPNVDNIGTSVADCDDRGVVGLGFHVNGEVPGALDALQTRALAQGWRLPEEPAAGRRCMEKDVDGVLSSMTLTESAWAPSSGEAELEPNPC